MSVSARAAALLLGIVVTSFAGVLAGEAQQSAGARRLGYLGTVSPAAAAPFLQAFREGLRELGYVEGENLAIEYRFAEGRPERLADLAAELVRLNVAIIVVGGTQAALAARQASSTIPIVVPVSGDAVGTGLAASLARPGGNVTGLTVTSPELSGKRLELLKEMAPGLSRVAVLWNPTDPPRVQDLRETRAAGRTLGIAVESVEVRAANELDRALVTLTRLRPDGVITLTDPLLNAHRTRIVERLAKHRLPAMHGVRGFVEAGGLMSYGPSFSDLYRRAATFVDKILRGTKPADLPFEQPTKFELVVNLRTAAALGLTIPQSVLLRAEEIIR